MKEDTPTAANGFGGVLPAGRLDILVRAAVGPDAPAAAWARYLQALGTYVPDEGERRLYPLVGARLGRALLSAPEYAPIARENRTATIRNVMTFSVAGRIDALLRAHGVRPILLKGPALQVRAFRDQVLRASSDVDVMVPPEDLGACLRAMKADGWKRLDGWPRADDPDTLRAAAGRMGFALPTGAMVDLHWVPRTALEFDPVGARAFVADAVEHDYRGKTWLIPSDPWLLFETLVHGVKYNPLTPVRWLTDALALVHMPDFSIDWDAWCVTVERARVRLTVALGLETMARYTDRVPAHVIDRLRETPSWGERLTSFSVLRRLPFPFQGLWLTLLHYSLRKPGSLAGKIIKFPRYYRIRILRCFSWADLGVRLTNRLQRAIRPALD